MLQYLHIENIAVIEQTSLDFSAGLNVLTGETGAGKSIIIDAIHAVLGERTSKELIRNGCDKALVSAVFSNMGQDGLNALAQNGYFPDEAGTFVVQRVLTPTGGSLRINGQPVTAGTMRELSRYLINIHGQHDNQALLDRDNHVYYIDRLAENRELREAYATEFRRFNTLRAALKALQMDEDEKLRKLDLLSYQIRELEMADIKIGELAAIKENIAVARRLDAQVAGLDKALSILCGGEDSDGVIDSLFSAAKYLDGETYAEVEEQRTSLRNAGESLRVCRDDLETYRRELTSGAYDPDALGERWQALNDLCRKYGPTEEAMLTFLEQARTEKEAIEQNDLRFEETEEALAASQEALVAKAAALTENRRRAAKQFATQVGTVLSSLNMAGVRFEVACEQGRYTRQGCDEIRFLISANAGEQPKPLSKIASGGELSRVMLAIKSVLAGKDDVDTLIFDEIDTGISGRTADRVGEQLKDVADCRQVICVTHLPQIASFAHAHLLIEKANRDGRTYTGVTALDDAGRIKEIARMMGGSLQTEELMHSAKELLLSHQSTRRML